MMTFIQAFLEELMHEAGYTDPVDIELFSQDLEPLLLERLYLTTMASLPEELHATAESLIDEDADGFHTLCKTHIPEYEEMIQTVLQDFADDYLEAIDGE